MGGVCVLVVVGVGVVNVGRGVDVVSGEGVGADVVGVDCCDFADEDVVNSVIAVGANTVVVCAIVVKVTFLDCVVPAVCLTPWVPTPVAFAVACAAAVRQKERIGWKEDPDMNWTNEFPWGVEGIVRCWP